MKKKIVKLLKILASSFVILLLLMFLLPKFFPNKIENQIKKFANQNSNGELNFKEANLSFFHHFPSLTLTLDEFSLKGSAPFKKDTLVFANEISLGINLKDLVFKGNVTVDKIFLSKAFFNIKVNENGDANYNIFVDSNNKKSNDTTSTRIKLDKIFIENSHLVYDDKSTKVLIEANGFNYTGKGNLGNDIFDLETVAKIEDFNLTFKNELYLKNKKVNANLITKINTNSLSFLFQHNNLRINKLPINFIGKLDFLKNGYNLDFKVQSKNSQLNDFFTALPPAYVSWLEKTKVKGTTDLLLTLNGKYIVSDNEKPNLAFAMKIRNGEINHKNAPQSASNLFLNFYTELPALDTQKFKVDIDSVFFNVGKDYVKAIIKTQGLNRPLIDAKIKTSVDLKNLVTAFGVENLDLKGKLNLDIDSKGIFDPKNQLYPKTIGKIVYKEGYLKTNYYPNPITDINIDGNFSSKTGLLKDIKVVLNPASFNFEGKPVFVSANLENLENLNYDIKAKGTLDLAKFNKVFSANNTVLQGYINADVVFKGNHADAVAAKFNRLKNSGVLQVKNIQANSQYLPKPFFIKNGDFEFRQDKMNFKNFNAIYGQSDFKMNGYMQNVIDFVLSENGILKGNFSIDANYINVDEFMSNSAKNQVSNNASDTNSSGVVIIPPNLDLQFDCKANKIDFDELKIKNLIGNVSFNKGKMQLNKSSFDIIGSNINMDVIYSNLSTKKAAFEMNVLANDFDVKRAYNEIKMFREMASAAENAEGTVSLVYKVSGKLNNNMQPIYPSLKGGGTLSVKNVKMKGFKMFSAVSKKTGKDALLNPDISKVDIKTTVKNNIISIERFKFKVAGFRPRLEGTTSFDGRLNLKMRLGLPPLGIIGIPLTITGNKENPKVKIGKKGEDIEETEYEESKSDSVKP